jgi:uncharacterized OB-fold protein
MDLTPYIQDSAAEEFLSRLREGRFQSTYCRKCEKIFYPPRIICPACLSGKLEWSDLPREGELLAFTWQEDALRCGKPDVLGVVALEGIGNVMSRIDAAYEDLSIGQKMAFDTWETPDGMVLHQFRPLE